MIKMLDLMLSAVMTPLVIFYVVRQFRHGSSARWLFWLGLGFLGEVVFSILDGDDWWTIGIVAVCSALYLYLSTCEPVQSFKQVWTEYRSKKYTD